jgi:hypothetical protein
MLFWRQLPEPDVILLQYIPIYRFEGLAFPIRIYLVFEKITVYSWLFVTEITRYHGNILIGAGWKVAL